VTARAADTAVGRGAWAEDLALRFLLDRGLVLVARNYRCRRGEIDLVMREREVLVFVEVRYRRGGGFGAGAETVDWRKRARLAASASHYLHTHPGASRRPCRFDVLSVGGSEPSVDWIPNAFQPEG
jgi:putative endonuclease